MKSLLNDIKFALRGLRRRPGFTVAAALTLALGIGSTVAVGSVVQALLLRPLPFPEADRLVRIMAFKGAEPGRLAQREIEELQRESGAFESVAAFYLSQYNISGDGPPEAAPSALTSHELFSVLGSRFALGGPYSAKDDFRLQMRVVLTHDLWQRRYGGDPDIVGTSIVLDGGPYVVDGVLEADATFPPGIGLFRQVTDYHGLDGRRHSVLARLRPDVSLDQAQQELTRLGLAWQKSFPELNAGVHFEVVPLRESWVGAARPFLLLLLGAVALVLLIAIANTAHLLLTRATERMEEMAVRTSLGASRWHLMRQAVVESVVLATLGGGLGLLLAMAGLRGFGGLVEANIPEWMAFRLDPSIFVAAAGLVLATGVVAGAAPALIVSRSALGQGLRGARGSVGGASPRLRGALVVAEIALALVLLAGAGLMLRSALALDRQDLGFDADQLLTLRVDPPYWSYNKIEQVTPFFEEAMDRLRQIPGVRDVAANQNLPLAGLDEHTKRILTLEGQSTTEQESNPFVHLQSVGPGYFQAMGIPLRRGRTFTTADREETRPIVVLSHRLASRLWPDDALGQRLKLGPPESEAPWMTVVGIAGDVRSESRSGEASLDLYVSHLQHFTGDTYFALRTSRGGAELRRQVEAAIHAVDADLPLFDVAPMGERLVQAEWQRETTGRLFSIFAALALALAAFGTYGVMSYHVTLRRKEMGVRQALGARPRDLVAEVIAQGLRFLVFGAFTGALAVLALGRWVESLLFGVAATDPVTFAVASFALALAVLCASFLPALRAARVAPLDAMRGE